MGLSGDSGKLFDKLQSGNDELKRMIKDILSHQGTNMPVQSVSQGGQVVSYNMGGGRFRPPQPSMGVDGDISSGYSHKFQ